MATVVVVRATRASRAAEHADEADGHLLRPQLIGNPLDVPERAMQALPKVIGLDEFRLPRGGTQRLAGHEATCAIDLQGLRLASLSHLVPSERRRRLMAALTAQRKRLVARFPQVAFIPRGRGGLQWILDATLPADKIMQLAKQRDVKFVLVNSIRGLPRKRVKAARPQRTWYCVWGIVAIQIENRMKGALDIEDRLVLVKAFDDDDARRRLTTEWRQYAKPYMNSEGRLVRWQLVSIRGVYRLSEGELDPAGTEVFSRLRSSRMKPEFVWRRPAPGRLTARSTRRTPASRGLQGRSRATGRAR